MITALILLAQSALARDWEQSEGKFLNRSESKVACYGDDKNHPGVICRRWITKGVTCLGDAVGLGDGAYVFKVPNRASFNIDGEEGIVLSPSNQLSWLLLDAARKLRPGRYGWITWTQFIKVMGSREVVACDEVCS